MESHEFRSLKGLRVLVVEDNSISQRLIYTILLQWQVSADLAANGKIAVEMMSENIYDVVLMDIMMPELDGYDATRAIRSLEGQYFQNLPIFAFSATPDPEKIIECSMTGHITKAPMDKVELHQRISMYLK
ncbi:MAG: response regulator [Bacteroidota bacterium]